MLGSVEGLLYTQSIRVSVHSSERVFPSPTPQASVAHHRFSVYRTLCSDPFWSWILPIARKIIFNITIVGLERVYNSIVSPASEENRIILYLEVCLIFVRPCKSRAFFNFLPPLFLLKLPLVPKSCAFSCALP